MPIDTTNTYRVEYFFHSGQYGWSETWWYRSVASIDQVHDRANDLAGKRIPLLASGCFLDEFTTSLQGLFRDSRQSDTKPANAAPNNKFVAENLYTAMLIRQQSGTRYRRNMYLRGLPKNITVPDAGDNPNAALFWGAFGQLKDYLVNTDANWSIQSISKEPADQGAAVNHFVQGAAQFASYTVIQPAVAGAATGDTVRLRSVRGAKALNLPVSGTYQVMAADGAGTTIGTVWLGNNNYAGGATAIKETGLHYSGGITLTPLRLVRRNAGVIHLQVKGRKRNRAS